MTIEETIRKIEYALEMETTEATAFGQLTAVNTDSLRVALAALRAQAEVEKDEPLTLEELRGMNGEPVWIAPIKEDGKIPARWMLVLDHSTEVDLYLFQPNSGIAKAYIGKSYGKTWLAYRRKPEEAPADG